MKVLLKVTGEKVEEAEKIFTKTNRELRSLDSKIEMVKKVYDNLERDFYNNKLNYLSDNFLLRKQARDSDVLKARIENMMTEREELAKKAEEHKHEWLERRKKLKSFESKMCFHGRITYEP